MATVFINDFNLISDNGQELWYDVVVYDDLGNIESKKRTMNKEEAQQAFNEAKEKYPNAEIKGEESKLSEDSLSSAPGPTGPMSSGALTGQAVESTVPHNAGAQGLTPPALSSTPTAGKSNATKKPAVYRKDSPGGDILDNASLEEQLEHRKSGFMQQCRVQPVPNYNKAESENVISGIDNNARICIGNDRPAGMESGYGGKGHTQCDAMYLVTGAAGARPKQVDDNGNRFWVNPNFFIDAAFVYLSQKTDCDKNLAIGSEDTRELTDAKSAFVAKADNIRIIGRETLKLVTKTDVINSQGGKDMSSGGVELMANNDEETLQPIPLGDNLENALMKLTEYIEQLSKMVHMQVQHQQKLNSAITSHYHHSPFFGLPTTPSPSVVPAGAQEAVETVVQYERAMLTEMTNLAGFRANFLLPSGEQYINSRYNKVN